MKPGDRVDRRRPGTGEVTLQDVVGRVGDLSGEGPVTAGGFHRKGGAGARHDLGDRDGAAVDAREGRVASEAATSIGATPSAPSVNDAVPSAALSGSIIGCACAAPGSGTCSLPAKQPGYHKRLKGRRAAAGRGDGSPGPPVALVARRGAADRRRRVPCGTSRETAKARPHCSWAVQDLPNLVRFRTDAVAIYQEPTSLLCRRGR
jgi:hypothetical protein